MNHYLYSKKIVFSLLITMIPAMSSYSQEVSSQLPIDFNLDFDQKGIKVLPALLNKRAELFQQAIIENKTDHSSLLKNTQDIQALYSSVFGTLKGKDFNSIFQRYSSLLFEYIQAVKKNSREAKQISEQLLMTSKILSQFLENEKDFNKVSELAIQEINAYLKGNTTEADRFHQELLSALQEFSSRMISLVGESTNRN